MRLSDCCGRLEDMCASLEDASCGIGYAVSGVSIACSFALFRRLCGSTSSVPVTPSAFAACCPPAFADLMDKIELCSSGLDFQNVSLNIGFARKYPSPKAPPPLVAAMAFSLCDGLEEIGLRDCSGAFASLRQHRRHSLFVSHTVIGRGSIGRKLMAA